MQPLKLRESRVFAYMAAVPYSTRYTPSGFFDQHYPVVTVGFDASRVRFDGSEADAHRSSHNDHVIGLSPRKKRLIQRRDGR
ncbi:MAG: hypothetical protein AB8B55_14770 [Mariniblastus sp.]